MATGPLSDIYNFTEKRFTAYSHSLRIYIYGAEVSAWLKGSLSITYSGRDSYNTASFELSNPRNIWIMTATNLGVNTSGTNPSNGYSFRLTGDMFGEDAKARIFTLKTSDHIAYWNILSYGAALGVTKPATNTATTSQGIYSANPYFPITPTQERKYRLAYNDCIFNKNDPIRIFSKNPFSSSDDEWVEVFCGFIQDHAVTTNYLNGESSVKISASCIKQQLQKMRVNVNVARANIDPSPIISAGFYQDFLNPSLTTHPFAISNLEQTIKNLILGSPTPPRDLSQETDDTKNNKIGTFKLGNIICYNAASPGNILERWHLMTMFGVNKKAFPDGGGVDNLWLTQQEMQTIGENTYSSLDSDAVVGGPSSRYLHMLLPTTGTGPASLITYDTVKSGNAPQAREWATRWEIIRDFAAKLDFQVLTSPSGDILVEFPQYGFTPCAYLTNFGAGTTPTVPTTASAAQAAKSSLSSALSGSNTPAGTPKAFPQCSNTANSIANLFVFDLHQKEGTLSDEAEDFPTILMVGGGFAFTPLNTSSPNQEVHSPRGYAYCPLLVDRYGVISESIDFPYAGQGGQENADSQSVLTKRLAQLALVEYTKRMADASTWQGSLVYRPFLFPNRPLQLNRDNRIGLTTGVTYQWNIGQSATMSINMHMLMAKRVQDGTYRLLTGSANTPIDYGAIWSSTDTSTSDGSVRYQSGSGKTTDPSTTQKTSTPDPKGSAEVPGSMTIPSVSPASLTNLYPPFATIMANLINAAAAAGIMLTITSGYRSPKQQASTNATHGVGYHPSNHELGFALDLAPTADPSGACTNFTKWRAPLYAALNAYTNAYPGAPVPNWGGNSPSFEHHSQGCHNDQTSADYDFVHFEIPRGWIDSSVARNIYNTAVKAGASDIQAAQTVWDAVNKINPAVNALNPTQGLPSSTNMAATTQTSNSTGQPGAATSTTGAAPATGNSGVPASCADSDDLLTVAGLSTEA